MSLIDTPNQKPASRRILSLLTPREREIFFSAEDRMALDGFGATSLAVSDLGVREWRTLLETHQPDAIITAWATPPLPEDWAGSADCPLHYVCHVTGSVRRLVPRVFLERGGLVSNWGTLVSPQVAEHALLLALGALRNMRAWRPYIQRDPAGRRIQEIDTRTLFGRSVGLHGLGSVARNLIPLLRPFGVRLRAFSAGVPESVMADAGVEPVGSLEELFAKSEVLFECEALTPASENSVTAAIIERLPANAVFVNVGRGNVVDENALVAASAAGRIRLAVDVSRFEPIRSDAGVCQLSDALVSPHIAGPTVDRYPDCGQRALENLRAYLRGETPPDTLSLPVYDRST